MDGILKHGFVWAAFLLIALEGTRAGASYHTTVPPLRVAVHLINKAANDEKLLDKVGMNIARIFQEIGIEILFATKDRGDAAWLSLPRQSHLYVHIITLENMKRLGFHPGESALGMVLGSAKDDGISMVYIFDDRVNRVLREKSQIDKAVLLSYAVAHEMGHILLHRNGHSNYGIMQRNWGYRALFDMSCEMLTFHDKEAKEIRTEVARRGASLAC